MSQENFSANTIYLDQAATSRPKAAGVGEAMRTYIEEVCANVHRSATRLLQRRAPCLETREYLVTVRADDPPHAFHTGAPASSPWW
jgi:selenocysteine lyase/cysteine desulfurase